MVTQGHWKRNHWVDHTRLTIRQVIGRWILSWPWNVSQRSLKVIEISAIRKLGCGFLFAFYSQTMAVSVAVCEIFSVKEWRDLEHQVRGRSRSLKMAPFDRPYAIFLLLVSHCKYSSILYHFRVFWRWKYRDLEILVIVIQCHWNWCHSKAWVRFPILLL